MNERPEREPEFFCAHCQEYVSLDLLVPSSENECCLSEVCRPCLTDTSGECEGPVERLPFDDPADYAEGSER